MSKEAGQFNLKAELSWETVEPGIRRQILGHDDALMLVRVAFDADAVGSVHAHPHSQQVIVESGEFDFTIGDETVRLVAGDSAHVPSNVMHGVVCRKAGVLVDAFSPARKDFL